MFDLLEELNNQANEICNEYIAARREEKAARGVKAAYHKGRAEELAKWQKSVEALIEKVTENRAQRKKEDAKQ